MLIIDRYNLFSRADKVNGQTDKDRRQTEMGRDGETQKWFEIDVAQKSE